MFPGVPDAPNPGSLNWIETNWIGWFKESGIGTFLLDHLYGSGLPNVTILYLLSASLKMSHNEVNGNFELRRGFEIKQGQKILIVEDVITTGKSSLECSNLAPKAGGEIIGYACLIDRSAGKSKINKQIVSQVEIDIPTYKEKDIPKHLKDKKAIKPGSRNL